jgi:hypothetical protein
MSEHAAKNKVKGGGKPRGIRLPDGTYKPASQLTAADFPGDTLDKGGIKVSIHLTPRAFLLARDLKKQNHRAFSVVIRDLIVEHAPDHLVASRSDLPERRLVVAISPLYSPVLCKVADTLGLHPASIVNELVSANLETLLARLCEQQRKWGKVDELDGPKKKKDGSP